MKSLLVGTALLLLGTGCDLGGPVPPPPPGDLAQPVGDLARVPVDAGGSSADLAGPAPDLAQRSLQAGFNDPQLATRQLSYGLALRSASLKLVGNLPTSDELTALAAAGDQRSFYEGRVSAYLADPRFATQMVAFFRNAFRTGGVVQGMPSFETAPTFAAQLVVQDRPFSEVVTATSGTCPTFANGVFTAASCTNNAPTAGVLTDPGVMALWTSNMAFRRARWVQETFACNKFPAEFRDQPVKIGGGLYTNPWDFDSISGSPVGFKATATVVCANCHGTINHLAPLFGNFDANGQYQSSIQVTTPVNGLPKTMMTDWLPMGQTTAWRSGTPAADLPSLGTAIAADPIFATCITTRVYDWAMSKDDIVVDSATVPDEVIAPYRDDLLAHQLKLRNTLYKVFTSDDFVRF